MAFCKHCGNQLPDDAAFCSNCGTPVDNAQQTGQQNVQQNAQQADQQTAQQAPQQPVQPQVMNPDGSPLPSEKGVAWLSYVGLLFLIPLFARKNSEYCKFHVKQGATLFAVEVAYTITKSIIMAILGAVFTTRYYGYRVYSTGYYVFDTIFNLAYIFFTVISIIGIVNAATGKKNELPLIGKIPWVGMLIDRIYAFINK